MRCERCCGRKKLFKINNIFSLTNTGGAEVSCPTCNGTGHALQVTEKECSDHQYDSEEKTAKKAKKI